jgi:hypothetical protein
MASARPTKTTKAPAKRVGQLVQSRVFSKNQATASGPAAVGAAELNIRRMAAMAFLDASFMVYDLRFHAPLTTFALMRNDADQFGAELARAAHHEVPYVADCKGQEPLTRRK